MKQGLMVVSTPPIINIGDYIQALAAKQYFNRIDCYIERERLSVYNGDPVKMIMNGWYMVEPQYWPPSNKIKPLFISFHINSLAKERMLQDDSIKYLKQHEPIGCRDIETMNILKEKGVNAYFSGCLTLTLNNTYKSKKRDNKIYFVDPAINIARNNKLSILKAFIYLILHFFTIKKLMKKFKHYKKRSGMWLVAAAFYKTYSKSFTDDFLFNAEYIDHESPEIGQQYKTNEEKFKRAEELIKMYSEAACVVTSRIHCALPCLSLETPVIYVKRGEQSQTSACRLNGLSDLFNVMVQNKNKLVPYFDKKGKISISNFPKNKDSYKKLQKDLRETSQAFASED